MADDDLRALVECQLVMRVHACLVLGEEDRVAHLSDVMVKGAGADQLRVRTDLGGRLGG